MGQCLSHQTEEAINSDSIEETDYRGVCTVKVSTVITRTSIAGKIKIIVHTT